MRKHIEIILIIFSALILRYYLILRDSVPFAYDMGRDLIWAKDISFYNIPTLIGPAASIWGVYFGPLWFYFLSVPLKIFNGNPVSAVYMTAFTILVTGFLAYYLFIKYFSKIFSLTLSIIILFSATLINLSTFAFHANILPILTLLTIYFSFLAVIKNPLYISLSFLFVSLMFHADPAPAAVFSIFPIVIYIYFKLFRKLFIKTLLFSFTLYSIPFIPQILFEIRNNFVQTKSLIAYFNGTNQSLSGQLPLSDRVTNRIIIYFDFFKDSFASDNNIITLFLIILIFIGIYKLLTGKVKQNIKILLKINLIALLTSYLVYTFPFSVEVKVWYLFGLTIVFSFLIALITYSFKISKAITYSFLFLFILVNISPKLIFNGNQLSDDPAQLRNQLTVLSIIEKDSIDDNYSIYIYTPSIYDLNFQYLFWWEGIVKNKGLPREFAYLPNKPEYVRNKHLYSQANPEAEVTYLVIEQNRENEFYTSSDWLSNFADKQIIWEKKINGAFTIQKRKS